MTLVMGRWKARGGSRAVWRVFSPRSSLRGNGKTATSGPEGERQNVPFLGPLTILLVKAPNLSIFFPFPFIVNATKTCRCLSLPFQWRTTIFQLPLNGYSEPRRKDTHTGPNTCKQMLLDSSRSYTITKRKLKTTIFL